MRSNNSHPSWRGDDAGRPRFGARGRAWLQAKLEAELPTRYTLSPEARTLVPRVAAFYVACWREVLLWVPAETYLGPGYATGAWRVDWPVVLHEPLAGEVWRAAERAAKAERDAAALAADAARYPTLDAWLDAERRGQLTHRGAYEEHAERFLPRLQGYKVIADAYTRRARWPRACRSCRREFRPVKTGRVRCDACLSAARERATVERAASPTQAGVIRRRRVQPAAPATGYMPGPHEPDPSDADVAHLIGYWTGLTATGLSALLPDDDPTSPVNRLAALVAHLERLGRRDAALPLRLVLNDARARLRQRREQLKRTP